MNDAPPVTRTFLEPHSKLIRSPSSARTQFESTGGGPDARVPARPSRTPPATEEVVGDRWTENPGAPSAGVRLGGKTLLSDRRIADRTEYASSIWVVAMSGRALPGTLST